MSARFSIPIQRVRTWSGAGPWLPRSSALGIGLLPPARGRDQLVERFLGQVVMKAVVVAHHGRVLAGAQALHRLAAEQPVPADLAVLADADLLLQVREDLLGAAQLAA